MTTQTTETHDVVAIRTEIKGLRDAIHAELADLRVKQAKVKELLALIHGDADVRRAAREARRAEHVAIVTAKREKRAEAKAKRDAEHQVLAAQRAEAKAKRDAERAVAKAKREEARKIADAERDARKAAREAAKVVKPTSVPTADPLTELAKAQVKVKKVKQTAAAVA